MLLRTFHLTAFLAGVSSFCNAFTTVQINKEIITPSFLKASENANDVLPESTANNNKSILSSIPSTRQAFLASMVTSTVGISTLSAAHADEEEGFASIAARASQITQAVEAEEAKKDEQDEDKAAAAAQNVDPRTVYDFSIPIAGEDIPFKDLIRQEFTTIELPGENEGEVITKSDAKVKAILVVNIKQDDPIARRNIPELISLASK